MQQPLFEGFRQFDTEYTDYPYDLNERDFALFEELNHCYVTYIDSPSARPGLALKINTIGEKHGRGSQRLKSYVRKWIKHRRADETTEFIDIFKLISWHILGFVYCDMMNLNGCRCRNAIIQSSPCHDSTVACASHKNSFKTRQRLLTQYINHDPAWVVMQYILVDHDAYTH